jgi:hypothetical protein
MATATKKAAATNRARQAKNVKAEGKAPRKPRPVAASPLNKTIATQRGKSVTAKAPPFDGGVPAKTKADKPAKLPKLKIPKSLGACADLLKELQEKRLAAQKLIDPIAEQEKQLRQHIIDNLPKSQLGGATGKRYRAEIVQKEVPVIEDRLKLQAYIKKTGAFDLLSTSLNAKAVADRWENKKTVPGVGKFKVTSLSVTKV